MSVQDNRAIARAAVVSTLLMVVCLPSLASQVWAADSSRVLKNPHRVEGLGALADGKLLVAHANQAVTIWDLETEEVYRTIEKPAAWVKIRAVACARRGKVVALVGTDKDKRSYAALWDVDSGAKIHEMALPGGGNVPGPDLSPDGRIVVWRETERSAKRGILRVFDTKERRVVNSYSMAVPSGRAAFGPLCVSADGLRLARVSDRETFEILDLRMGKIQHRRHDGWWLAHVAMSADGRRVAVTDVRSGDRLLIWNLETSQLEHVISRRELSVKPHQIHFFGDGSHIVASEYNRTAVVEASTGRVISRLEGRWTAVSRDLLARAYGDEIHLQTVATWQEMVDEVAGYRVLAPGALEFKARTQDTEWGRVDERLHRALVEQSKFDRYFITADTSLETEKYVEAFPELEQRIERERKSWIEATEGDYPGQLKVAKASHRAVTIDGLPGFRQRLVGTFRGKTVMTTNVVNLYDAATRRLYTLEIQEWHLRYAPFRYTEADFDRFFASFRRLKSQAPVADEVQDVTPLVPESQQVIVRESSLTPAGAAAPRTTPTVRAETQVAPIRRPAVPQLARRPIGAKIQAGIALSGTVRQHNVGPIRATLTIDSSEGNRVTARLFLDSVTSSRAPNRRVPVAATLSMEGVVYGDGRYMQLIVRDVSQPRAASFRIGRDNIGIAYRGTLTAEGFSGRVHTNASAAAGRNSFDFAFGGR